MYAIFSRCMLIAAGAAYCLRTRATAKITGRSTTSSAQLSTKSIPLAAPQRSPSCPRNLAKIHGSYCAWQAPPSLTRFMAQLWRMENANSLSLVPYEGHCTIATCGETMKKGAFGIPESFLAYPDGTAVEETILGP